jgi:hypothetical protein
MVTMIYPDPQTARLLVRQRQDAYESDAALARLAQPLVELRRERRRRRLGQLLLHLGQFTESLRRASPPPRGPALG